MNRKLIATGILLGIGLGGFLDGIFFHQLFQMHNMLSAKLPPETVVNLKTNMFWDGLFHTLTWITTTISLIMLWKILQRNNVNLSGRELFGSAIMGWGIFNLIEGLIDHIVMDVHHVMQTLGRSLYDYAFLAFGLCLILLGYYIIRSSRKQHLEEIENIGAALKSASKENINVEKKAILPGFIMGVGLGGILEGILFFQVFQLHNMVSAIYPPDSVENIRTAMVFDGLYHLFTWVIIVVAVYMLWLKKKIQKIPLSGKTYVASAIFGLALLNITEGIIDHHIFQIHHVVERLGPSVYDYVFLGVSALIGMTSYIMIQNKRAHSIS